MTLLSYDVLLLSPQIEPINVWHYVFDNIKPQVWLNFFNYVLMKSQLNSNYICNTTDIGVAGYAELYYIVFYFLWRDYVL